jgi:hypothetical protein
MTSEHFSLVKLRLRRLYPFRMKARQERGVRPAVSRDLEERSLAYMGELA